MTGVIKDGTDAFENESDISKAPGSAAYSPLRWAVAAVMFVSVVSGFFDRISIAVLFTDHGFNAAMGTGFHPAILGALMTAFLLSYAFAACFLSFAGDLFGPRLTLGWASGLWGVLMVAMGSTGSFGAMLLLRVLLGLSEGPQFSLISKIIQRWFPRHEQARANSIWIVGSPVGSAIGFPLTIWLVANYGWRASFYVLGAFSLFLVMPLVLALIRDYPGMDATVPTAPKRPNGLTFAEITSVLSNKQIWMLAVFAGGLLTYLWGLNSWLPTYLQRVRHFDLHRMGLYSSLPFILMFFTELLAGYIGDKTGKHALLSIVGSVLAGALLYLGTIIPQPQLAAITIALSAAGWGLAVPSQFSLALRVLPVETTSLGVGIFNGIGSFIGACAPVVIGFIVEVTGKFQSGLLVVVAACFLGAAALLPMVKWSETRVKA